jgi:hypothetical protein
MQGAMLNLMLPVARKLPVVFEGAALFAVHDCR